MLQADAKAALKSDSEDNQSEGEDEGSDAEKSDDSGFGFEKKKGKNKKVVAPLKRLRGKTPGEAPEPVAQAPPPVLASAETASVSSAGNKSAGSGSQKPEKLASSATTLLNGLRAVSPLQIWQQTARSKDYDVKVTKAMDIVTKLRDFPENKGCEDIAKELAPIAEKLSNFLDLTNRFKPKQGKTMTADVLAMNFKISKDQLTSACSTLPVEGAKVVMIDLGKMLAEAGVRRLH